MRVTQIAAVVLFAAGAFIFLLNAIDYSGIEMAWGFFLSTCGFIVERLD